jgi:predicted RNA-binding Zn-ribbon protein involved in translation (DUF1610 family)
MKFNFDDIDCPTNCGGKAVVRCTILSPFSERFEKRISIESFKYSCSDCGFSFTTSEIDDITHRNYRRVINVEERKVKISKIWKLTFTNI